jgi:hypothetical protein
MAIKVKYDDIAFAFDFVSSDRPYINEAYLSKETGKFYYDSPYADDDMFDTPPEDVINTDDYIQIPHKNDLNLGYRLVRAFVRIHIPEEMSQVELFFNAPGAYARLKDLLKREDLLQEWYQFEADRTESKLRSWCELKGIELED